MPHIFDRFYQSKRPEATAQGGTGIGLSLAAELSTLLGGKIWAESPDPKSGDKGSIFYFRFPKVEVTASGDKPEFEQKGFIATPLPSPGMEISPDSIATRPFQEDSASKSTILIVEDNPELRSYMQLLLEDEYQVITAENGKVGWELLTAKPFEPIANLSTPDLIISDLMMPVMDGFKLLEKIKSHQVLRYLPVIMLTARADVRVKLRALRIGVDDYLTKPFVEEELLVRIKNLLYNYSERVKALAENLREAETSLPENTDPVSLDANWLEQVEEVFFKILPESQFKMDWVAGQMNLSERQFGRRLKQHTGLTPNNYLREMRLQWAKDYLHEGKYASVKEVGFAVGFSDTKYFSGLFQGRFGVLPSAYLS
ncbi:MAG: response regulator [Saprospiraceae bacterium]|nr:response regulator [Saprospiraceae bacterium]